MKDVLSSKPEYGMAHFYMGIVNYDKRSYSAAKKEFETYKKLKPAPATTQRNHRARKVAAALTIALRTIAAHRRMVMRSIP